VQAAGGISTQIDISLTEAADNVSLSVIDDATGRVVYQGDLGPQTAGTISTTWSGVDDQGQSLLRGSYSFLAIAENGARRIEQSSQAVAKVQSVIWNPSTQTMNLELSGGANITMADIERISG
jgi:flagellar hook assembly protein FlgD